MNLLIARLARSDPKLALETALTLRHRRRRKDRIYGRRLGIEVALTAWVHQDAGQHQSGCKTIQPSGALIG